MTLFKNSFLLLSVSQSKKSQLIPKKRFQKLSRLIKNLSFLTLKLICIYQEQMKCLVSFHPYYSKPWCKKNCKNFHQDHKKLTKCWLSLETHFERTINHPTHLLNFSNLVECWVKELLVRFILQCISLCENVLLLKWFQKMSFMMRRQSRSCSERLEFWNRWDIKM